MRLNESLEKLSQGEKDENGDSAATVPEDESEAEPKKKLTPQEIEEETERLHNVSILLFSDIIIFLIFNICTFYFLIFLYFLFI